MKKLFIIFLFVATVFTGFAQNLVKMQECVIENGALKQVTLDYNTATGDRTIMLNGVRKNFYDVYPKLSREYAGGETWYINNEAVLFEGRSYIKYGLPRVLGLTDISKAGVYKGVGVYTETGLTGKPEVIYIPVRQGCEFQPYQYSCGRISIVQGNSSASAMQFSAVTTGLTGKISFNWQVQGVTIIAGQGTGDIAVDVKNKKDGESFDVTVTASDAKKCPVTSYKKITVTKPGTSKDKVTKWTATDRKKFMESCVPSTKMGEEKGSAYCSCMLIKIEKLHPDPLTVDKELKQETIVAMAKECMQQKN